MSHSEIHSLSNNFRHDFANDLQKLRAIVNLLLEEGQLDQKEIDMLLKEGHQLQENINKKWSQLKNKFT